MTCFLFLDVLGPVEDAKILYDAVVVYGVTNPGASVQVNGVDATVDEGGRFHAEIALTIGANVIEVVAMDAMENRVTRVLNVTSLALPPLPHFLVVTAPQDQSIVSESPIRVSGRTIPDAVASVNGVSVSVDELGIYSVMVTLAQGPNIIDVVATSPEGEVLSAVIAVIYRP